MAIHELQQVEIEGQVWVVVITPRWCCLERSHLREKCNEEKNVKAVSSKPSVKELPAFSKATFTKESNQLKREG